jgi:hypothetical protein
LWGARGTATFTGLVPFEWSSDGTNWNSVSYTQVSYNATWSLVNSGTRISLPSGAAGVSNLRFRFTATSTNSGNFRIDDFTVQGISSSSPTLSSQTLTSALTSTFGTASTGVSTSATGSNLTNTITIMHIPVILTTQFQFKVST